MGLKATDPCLAKVADDEPIFVLRAQDRLAPEIVREWAHRAHLLGVPPAKVEDAYKLADKMERWGAEHVRKVPD